jgi:hypothetical protein
LGRRTFFSHREYVYQAQDCFELDEIQNYEVTRKRVFFDDVLLVTLHRFIPWLSVVAALLLFVFLGLFSLAVGQAGRVGGIIMFALTALPALVYAVLVIVFRGSAVTIHGRRTRARMDFGLRSSRARNVYRLACRLVRDAEWEPTNRPLRAPAGVEAPPPEHAV